MHGFESQGEMVNICTAFDLSNTTPQVTDIIKTLPFIYITSPAYLRHQISQCRTMCLTLSVSKNSKYKQEWQKAAKPF
jgi:hypothetical protein